MIFLKCIEVLSDKCTTYIRVTILTVLDCILIISFGVYLYCGCCKLLCNVWVFVCVGFVVCGCVYVWVCNVWVCVYVGFVVCGCV